MFSKLEERPVGWAERWPALKFANDTVAIADAELRKIFRDPTELFSRAVQPVLWLIIFGQVFSQIRGIPTGNISYLAFMTPGILAQSVLFSAIFYGIGVIWERDLGIVHKLLVTPSSRGALVLGKAVSAGFRGIVQAVIIYLVALALRIEIRWEVFAIAGVVSGVILGSAIFSTFSLIIACIVKTRERFMGIGQVLTMPLFFASNAIYPLEMMPDWLKRVAGFNPLTFLVDVLRRLMIEGGRGAHSLAADFGVMAVVLLIMILIASRLYSTLAR
ncbi:MAG TPA: ABC transporter permease [Nitrospiria bacterium]|nr:ABC transporter permease [Nitrospiria bacterium]